MLNEMQSDAPLIMYTPDVFYGLLIFYKTNRTQGFFLFIHNFP